MRKISKAAALAAILILSAPFAGALAQNTTGGGNPAWNEIYDAGFTYSVSIPTVLAVGSSMSEAALRDALSGNFLEHADELSALNATSITIPEVTLTYAVSGYGEPTTQSVSYRDIVLSNIKDGIAQTATMGESGTKSAMIDQSASAMTLTDFNIGAIFRLINGNGGVDAPLETIYSSSVTGGQTMTSSEFKCEIGASKSGAVRAKPLPLSIEEFLKLSDKLTKVGGDTSKIAPEDFRSYIGFVTAAFHSFEYEKTHFDGFTCSGNGPDGKPFTVGLGPTEIDGYLDGKLLDIRFKDFKIAADDGSVSLGDATFKALDFKPWIETIEANLDTLTTDWLAKNWRLLTPSWDGFDFGGLAVDVPDTNVPGGRVNVKVADFDLSLSDYVNGIPSWIGSFAKEVEVPFSETSTDPQIGMLLAMGMKVVNLGYDLSAHWDEASKSIAISNISVSGKDLGSLAVAANIGNAAEQIFAVDTNVALAALMGVTVKDLKIDLTDEGLADIALPILAAQQGADPKTFRQQMAGMAEGVVIGLLGSTDAARQLGQAISSFINGTTGSVSISVVAKDPAGIAIPMLMQASQNPALLGDQVTITGGTP